MVLLISLFAEQTLTNLNKLAGLIIMNARYGNLHDELEAKAGDHDRLEPYIDVTVPLQNLVQRSELHLQAYTKSKLEGFYDPCPTEEKSLEICYSFKGKVHRVEIEDFEPVKIPFREHLFRI